VASTDVAVGPLAGPACFDLIVIAASTGGLTAISALLAALPADFPVPIVVLCHRTSARPSLLTQVLGRQTTLMVTEARPGEVPHGGTVYVAPPNFHLTFTPTHAFALSDGVRQQHVLSSADVLFRSAAAVYGNRVIAVVLTGYGRDGAEGARAIAEAGGVVLAQDEASSVAFSMPAATIATGETDAVLPLARIAPALIALIAGGTVA
jgi:two-component system chemotaxis response regulator CheB